MLAEQNNAEEQNPCLIITKNMPCRPQYVCLTKPIITKAIWQTDERAINDLMSTWDKQTNPITTPPRDAHPINQNAFIHKKSGNRGQIR